MKESLKVLAKRQAAAEPDRPQVGDDGTPECVACGEHNIKLGSEALLILRGTWMPYRPRDCAAFVVDSTTQLHIEELPNGQLAIIPDVQGHPTKHAHAECIKDLVNDAMLPEYDEDEDDFSYDEDDEDNE